MKTRTALQITTRLRFLTRSQRALRFLISPLGAVALLLPSIGHAETWTFDPTFQRTPLRVTSESASGVKVLSSGKVLTYSINGKFLSGANGQRIGALLRMDPNTGAIDPTWNPDPTLTAAGFLGVTEAPDGKIYYATALTGDLAGNTSDPAVNRLIRLNTDGSRDTSFNSPVFAFNARFLGVQPDGKIIVCFARGINGVPPAGSILHTVRLNTDGTLDTTFQSPNFQFNSTDPLSSDLGVFGPPVVDSATGKIYFCGFFRFVNGQARKAIVRCNADGTVDSGFVPTGLIGGTTTLTGRAMALQAGGKVVLGGNNLRTAAGGSTRYALLRFNTDGTLDSSFTLFPTTNSSGTALVPGYFGPRHISAVPGGNILTSDIRVLRFLAGGALDSTFTPLDYTSPYFTNTGQVAGFRFDVNQNTGAAYLENPYPLYARLGGVPVPGNITKLNPDGTIDTQFISPIVESENFAPDVQIAASGAVYVSGGHTAFGSSGNATISRLLANGTRDAAYSLDTLPFADKQATGFALLPDSSAYVIYYSGSFNGGYQFSNLVRLLPTGALDTSFRPSSALQTAFSINAFDGSDIAKSSVGKISAAPMGRAYLFPEGAQATVNANGNLKLTRVNADGTEDTSVPALGFPLGEVTRDASGITGGSAGYLHRLAQTADGGLIVLASVAPFPTSTGAPYNYKLIKFLADGSQDPNFASTSLTSTAPAILDFPLLFDPVTGLTTQPPNGFYTAGAFPVSSAAILPDGSVLLAGNFRLTGGSTDYSLAKLTPAGAFDNSFTPPVPQNIARPTRPAVITNVRVAPDGKIWVLGRFDTFGGAPAPGVARLNPNGSLDTTFSLTGVGYYDSFGDSADVVFASTTAALLVGTFRRPGEPIPFAVTRIVNPASPIITSPTSASATQGQPFTYQISASNGPTSFNATGLPAGLQVNTTTGLINGTPSVNGSFTVGLSATNANGTGAATLSLTVMANGPRPTIDSPLTATATRGQAFTYQVLTTGAMQVSASNLPAGLRFDAPLRAILGTPTVAGVFQVQLSATNSAGTTHATLALTIQNPPASGFIFIVSSTSATGRTGSPFSFQVRATGGTSAARLSATGLPAGLTINAVTGLISGTPTANGSFAVNLTVTDGNRTAVGTLQLTFTSDPALPVIVSATSATLNAGQPFTYTIQAPNSASPGDPTIFRIEGTLPDGLIFDAATGTISGTYNGSGMASRPATFNGSFLGGVQLFATNSHGTTTSSLTFFLRRPGLANISTRLAVGTGDNVLIGGFIVTGDAPKKVIIRAIGGSLSVAGNPLPGRLQDTTLELHSASALLASNDDWRTSQEQEVIDSTVPPADDRESAIVATLDPGPYTAIVRGKNGSTGIALIEAYDLGTATLNVSSVAQLANISTRGFVQTGDDVMIGGTIVTGGARRLLIRALGPSLTAQGVSGALQDTTLELFDANGSILSNDDWRSTQEQEIIATTLPPTDNREAAIVTTLNSGAYTAIVRGKNGSTGVALVEVYALP